MKPVLRLAVILFMAVLISVLFWTDDAARADSSLDAAREEARRVLGVVCPDGLEDGETLARRLGYSALESDTGAGPVVRRRRAIVTDPKHGRLMLTERRRAGAVDYIELRAQVSVAGALRPVLMVRVNADCLPITARALGYDERGKPSRLLDLDAALNTAGSPVDLNPAVPPGIDFGGVRVGQIDSGVNYRLPEIASRLARDTAGFSLGWDYWDDDPRPFDMSPVPNPFFPLHHGTAVASVLLREAPAASLVPYRYPRPTMARMAELIDAAAEAGVTIMMVPMGSRRAGEWHGFLSAALRHPEMLFVVSAGDDGLDLERDALYPASFGLANMLVVTSSDDFGRLAEGANWGVGSIHVMAPGERVPVTDHRGAAGKASGSSFAVPRVAALSARLKERNPAWTAPELKAAILARAVAPLMRGRPVVSAGWLANPAAD